MAGVLAVCVSFGVNFYTIHYYFHLLSCKEGLGKYILTAANLGLSLSNQHKRHALFSGS